MVKLNIVQLNRQKNNVVGSVTFAWSQRRVHTNHCIIENQKCEIGFVTIFIHRQNIYVKEYSFYGP